MYPINSATEALFTQGSKQYINIAFDGTESAMTITQANVLENGLSINRFSASSNKIELGSVSASELTLKLDNRNGIYNDTTFEGAELFVRVGVKNDADVMTYVPLGYFTVDEAPRKLSQITLTALDRMVMFDKPASASDITFPVSVQNFVNRICTLCGVSLATTDFSGFANANYVINEFPTGNNITYRQILSWLAEILGVCAFIDWDGKLALKWYSDTSISFDTHNRYISDLQENAITITGIQVVQDGQTYSAGTEGYVISIEGNPLIQHDYQSIATALNTKLNGFSYTPFTATVLPMPYIYPLDKATYIDKNGVSHAVIITDVTFTTGKSTEIQGKGESTTKSNYASIDPLTKGERIIISELKKEMDNKITAKEQALIELNKIIGNALGLYTTAVKDETGATTYYFHNGDTLANSNIIYTFGSGGFAWTNSWNGGSPVWNYGITKDGNAILNVLSTYKIISDYIEAEAVTTDKIKSGAVTAEKINVTDLFAEDINFSGTITGESKTVGSSSFKMIVDGANSVIKFVDPADDSHEFLTISPESGIKIGRYLSVIGLTVGGAQIGRYGLDYEGDGVSIDVNNNGNLTLWYYDSMATLTNQVSLIDIFADFDSTKGTVQSQIESASVGGGLTEYTEDEIQALWDDVFNS